MAKKKIVTILGTRPEIIRLSQIIPKLDSLANHVLVHTGQNANHSLSDIFFAELGIRAPDHYLGIETSSAAGQIAQIIARCDEIFDREEPDRVLILGDTNSGLSAFPAKRRGIPVFHMEAGNRCYDDRVPEEVNRRVIDHSSDVLLPYTESSRRNLLNEGIHSSRIHVTGNPINEVMVSYREGINASDILDRLELQTCGYVLVTLHRAENVDIEPRLRTFAAALQRTAADLQLPVLVSTHPRTRNRMNNLGINDSPNVTFMEPFGFFDFVKLEKNAQCVLSDSGTVQEECCLLNVPTVTLRDTTERPETIDCGSNILSGCDEDQILSAIECVTQLAPAWTPPVEYTVDNVSEVVCRLMIGYFDDHSR